MTYYLGIDGGGTKTTCAVGDETTVVASATAGPSNIVRVGEARARESLHSAVRQACAAAGIRPDQVEGTCVGGSGAAGPELARVVREIIAEMIPLPIEVVGDMEIALEAAVDSGPGVIVIAGTGSIAYGRDRLGRTLRAGGWGFMIGDEGSAHWIGRSAVIALLRASDANEAAAKSALAAELFAVWKVNSLADLARAANSIPPPDFAALFRAVLGSQDELATQVLKNAGRELAEIASIVMRRLFAEDQTGSVPVAMTGGVFRHSSVVRDSFYNELRRLESRAKVIPEVVEPVKGALSIARRLAKQLS